MEKKKRRRRKKKLLSVFSAAYIIDVYSVGVRHKLIIKMCLSGTNGQRHPALQTNRPSAYSSVCLPVRLLNFYSKVGSAWGQRCVITKTIFSLFSLIKLQAKLFRLNYDFWLLNLDSRTFWCSSVHPCASDTWAIKFLIVVTISVEVGPAKTAVALLSGIPGPGTGNSNGDLTRNRIDAIRVAI